MDGQLRTYFSLIYAVFMHQFSPKGAYFVNYVEWQFWVRMYYELKVCNANGKFPIFSVFQY